MPDLSALLDTVSEIPFGKYRGQPLDSAVRKDPDYFDWMLANASHWWVQENRETIKDVLRQHAQEKAISVDINLTDHQSVVVDELLHAINEHGLPIVRLEGGAGYGKSYATIAIAKDLIERGYKVRATAVSYVATQVLAEQLDPLGVTCATLARTLKFRKGFIDGQEVYGLSEDSAEAAASILAQNNALIVDECSMGNDEIARFLFDTVNTSGGVLILVGDSKQLPPVKQETRSLFCSPWSLGVAMLTKPMRYSEESALYQVEQIARNKPWSLFDTVQTTDGIEVVHNHDELIDRYVKNYQADPGTLHRMLLFRRHEVVGSNNAIREALWGPDADLVVEDERLMILATSDYPYVKNPAPGTTTRYYSGQHFRVKDTVQDSYTINVDGESFTIPHYIVTWHETNKTSRIIFGVSEAQTDETKLGGKQFSAAMRAALAYGKLEDKDGNRVGDWVPYNTLMQDFVRVAYTYATSVHRAQGQTCDYAYCEPRTLLGVRGIMGEALAYVALTRARKQLTVLL